MADKVHITKHGFQVLRWDGEVRQYVGRDISSTLEILRCTCHIDAGVTLRDIFQIVGRDQELAGFLRAWAGCDLDAFHAEAAKPPARTSDLTSIEIAKFFESFHGSPGARDERLGELQESIREIGEGRAELTPFEPPKDLLN